ncbi:MAG: hypothetical protein VX951_08730 [Planctomycetota bacterium]|nr:hypothetical protein [Planctomycetota bacterium]
MLLVVDQDAGAGHRGAIFKLDPETRKVRLFARSELFFKPQDILQEPDGSFLVLDFGPDHRDGKIFRLSQDGTRCHRLPIPDGLADPYQFERAPDGSIWIVDKNADPRGLAKDTPGKTGTLWRLSADFKSLTVIATGPPLRAPAGILFADGGSFLLDADAFRTEPYKLSNGEGGILSIHPEPTPPTAVVKFKSLVSPLGMHRLADGRFLVIDVNADPEIRQRIRGAVYVATPGSGNTELFATHPDFRDPVNCLFFDGALLVADPNADPLKLGDDGHRLSQYAGKGHGGIYRIDLATRKVELFAASKEFISPIRIRRAELQP